MVCPIVPPILSVEKWSAVSPRAFCHEHTAARTSQHTEREERREREEREEREREREERGEEREEKREKRGEREAVCANLKISISSQLE